MLSFSRSASLSSDIRTLVWVEAKTRSQRRADLTLDLKGDMLTKVLELSIITFF